MADTKTNVIFKYGLEENVKDKNLFSPGTIYFSILNKYDTDKTTVKERVGKIYYDYSDGKGNTEKVDMTRLAHTLTINGKTFNDGEDLDVGVLDVKYGGTGTDSYVRNRILYVTGNDTTGGTWFESASNIYSNGSLLAIGVDGVSDISSQIGGNALTVVSGITEFLDRVKITSATDLGAAPSYYPVYTDEKYLNYRTIEDMAADLEASSYGVCETAANVAEKVVTTTSGKTVLRVGATVTVKFVNNNTVASPTLNVDGTGAINIMRYGTTKASTSSATSWYNGLVQTFRYDGSYWLLNGNLNTDTNTLVRAYAKDISTSYVMNRDLPLLTFSSTFASVDANSNKYIQYYPFVTYGLTVNPSTGLLKGLNADFSETLSAYDIKLTNFVDLNDSPNYYAVYDDNNCLKYRTIAETTADLEASHYGTCSTPATTAAKVATTTNGTTILKTGVTVAIKFSETNSVSNPTLNVDNTGAKAIKRYGTSAPSTNTSNSWYANQIVIFRYDGTYWMMTSSTNTDTNTQVRLYASQISESYPINTDLPIVVSPRTFAAIDANSNKYVTYYTYVSDNITLNPSTGLLKGTEASFETLTSTSIFKSTGTVDATYSKDTKAAISTLGGIAVEKLLSANTVRIDGNSEDAGCILQFDVSNNCLLFNFVGDTSSVLQSADTRAW